jgi:hypothetical protein
MTDIAVTATSTPITATATSSGVSAAVSSSTVSASAGGGIGPQGPSGDAGGGGGATLSDATPLAPGAASAGTAATASRSDHRHSAPAIGDISGLQAAIDGKQASGSYAAASHTHISSQISDFDTAVAAAAPATTNAGLLTSGTLSDARLSANIVTTAVLAARQHQTTSFFDVFDRVNINTAVAPVSGAEYWSFFTPSHSLTITQITMASVNAASSVTLARFGLYTANAAGEATLVARTASDTTIFSASNTIYTRSLDSTGGYPTSYALTAGTRYAVSMCLVSSGGTGTVSAVSVASGIGALSPRVQGVRTGVTDLVTSQGSGQYNGAVGHAYWARLS